MRRFAIPILAAFAFSTLSTAVHAQNGCGHPQNGCCHKRNLPEEDSRDVAPLTPAPDFLAFTGKVVKNKVRLRHQPNLDSPILKELNHGDLLVIVGETEDFYAVQPPVGTKAYVFRTFVLDNIVEGNRVNVRLEPDVEAPVIAQLSTGHKIEGNLSPNNNKWIEINPPSTVKFYIAKDYIEKLGDPSLITTIEKRREEADLLLNTTFLTSQNEMQKTFPEVRLGDVYANYNKIISHYQDFPKQVAKAKERIETLEESYLQKKISYLEQKALHAQDEWQNKNTQLTDQMKAQQQRLAQLEQQIKKGKQEKTEGQVANNSQSTSTPELNSKMAAWIPVEEAVYRHWTEQNSNRSIEDFYNEQKREPILIKGILEPYTRVIKNKPGDYVLIDKTNNLPIAFVYSTHVNLQNHLGKEVTLHAAHRPNHHFAFPAFFVLFVE